MKEPKLGVAAKSQKCVTCEYRWGCKEIGYICDYLGRTGHLRRCPPGDDCTEYKPKTSNRRFGRNYKI